MSDCELLINETLEDILKEFGQRCTVHVELKESGIAKDVVRFLDELFADRLLMWRSVDGRTRGWRERGDAGHSAPLVIDDREYQLFVWSQPLGVWRATPIVLARGSIQDDREYEIVVQRVNNEGPDRLQGSERDALRRIVEEYEKKRTSG